jgi:two-component system, OmpR family, sensor histidine kinase KdpD
MLQVMRSADALVTGRAPARWNALASRVGAWLGSAAMVAAALIAGELLRGAHIGVANIALVFLLPALLAAITYGLMPALFACLLSVLAYNFFFLPPLYTLTIADTDNVVTLLIFAFVAVVASNLAARVRAQAVSERHRAQVTDSLFRFSRKLAEVFALDDLLWAICYQIAHLLKARTVLLLPDGDDVAVRAGYPPEDNLSTDDIAAATQTLRSGAPAGRGTSERGGAGRFYLPLRTGRGTLGVVGLERDGADWTLSADEERLLHALADQAALAIERMQLAEDIERSKMAAETERLRTALLTSLSHDLRTPLASILGSATSLKHHRSSLDEAAQTELLATIEEEAQRLHRFIANLLDMTRLESGGLAPRLEMVDVGDVIGSALNRATDILAQHRIVLDVASGLPMVKLDPVLFEQVLFNLLDNAAKYAPAGTGILLRARSEENSVAIEVADEGSGIPPADLGRIFDPFYRVESADRKRAGTGLGLAICRGFVEAMGGTIVALKRPGTIGALFRIAFPAGAAR